MPRFNPLNDEQAENIRKLKADLPQIVHTRVDWESPGGVAFLEAALKLQMEHQVKVPEIADAAGIPRTALSNALGKYARRNTRARKMKKKVKGE
jgi:hypothetical protein